jgi:hypothetical protein
MGKGVEHKEGVPIDPKKLVQEEEGPRPFLPKSWIVERTLWRGWDTTGG